MWQINYPVSNLVSCHQGTLRVLIAAHMAVTRSLRMCPSAAVKRHRRVATSIKPATCTPATSQLASRSACRTSSAKHPMSSLRNRKYIDANRSRECVFEVAGAEPFYNEYHATLPEFVDEIRAENGGLGLLFDIHGTAGIAEDPAHIYLGTDGKTVTRLRAAHRSVLFRRSCLRDFLEAVGYVVSPRKPGVLEAPSSAADSNDPGNASRAGRADERPHMNRYPASRAAAPDIGFSERLSRRMSRASLRLTAQDRPAQRRMIITCWTS
jgi:hypothetical protein